MKIIKKVLLVSFIAFSMTTNLCVFANAEKTKTPNVQLEEKNIDVQLDEELVTLSFLGLNIIHQLYNE